MRAVALAIAALLLMAVAVLGVIRGSAGFAQAQRISETHSTAADPGALRRSAGAMLVTAFLAVMLLCAAVVDRAVAGFALALIASAIAALALTPPPSVSPHGAISPREAAYLLTALSAGGVVWVAAAARFATRTSAPASQFAAGVL
jgi:hypothetical protein